MVRFSYFDICSLTSTHKLCCSESHTSRRKRTESEVAAVAVGMADEVVGVLAWVAWPGVGVAPLVASAGSSARLKAAAVARPATFSTWPHLPALL